MRGSRIHQEGKEIRQRWYKDKDTVKRPDMSMILLMITKLEILSTVLSALLGKIYK